MEIVSMIKISIDKNVADSRQTDYNKHLTPAD